MSKIDERRVKVMEPELFEAVLHLDAWVRDVGHLRQPSFAADVQTVLKQVKLDANRECAFEERTSTMVNRLEELECMAQVRIDRIVELERQATKDQEHKEAMLNEATKFVEELLALRLEIDRLQTWVGDLTTHSANLLKEVERLKAGNLTAEEFQNLCHNLHQRDIPCSREEFERGCRETQDALFLRPNVLGSNATAVWSPPPTLSGKRCPITGLPIECVDPKEYD